LRKLCQYKHNNDSNSVNKPVIVDTTARDEVQKNEEVKENLDKSIRGRNDNVSNKKVNAIDYKARNFIDKTVEVDMEFQLDSASKNTDCVVCKVKLHGKKKIKCYECELDVCQGCHKKTFITKEWFMCLVCQ
jgi:hypothetical protein